MTRWDFWSGRLLMGGWLKCFSELLLGLCKSEKKNIKNVWDAFRSRKRLLRSNYFHSRTNCDFVVNYLIPIIGGTMGLSVVYDRWWMESKLFWSAIATFVKEKIYNIIVYFRCIQEITNKPVYLPTSGEERSTTKDHWSDHQLKWKLICKSRLFGTEFK